MNEELLVLKLDSEVRNIRLVIDFLKLGRYVLERKLNFVHTRGNVRRNIIWRTQSRHFVVYLIWWYRNIIEKKNRKLKLYNKCFLPNAKKNFNHITWLTERLLFESKRFFYMRKLYFSYFLAFSIIYLQFLFYTITKNDILFISLRETKFIFLHL